MRDAKIWLGSRVVLRPGEHGGWAVEIGSGHPGCIGTEAFFSTFDGALDWLRSIPRPALREGQEAREVAA